ncbi:hypothetical protein GCM10007242_38550 [Pigmentiphaga litoralis]|jgi:hypothetical protein|uniref:DUF4286 family protein n=1 Tax=Pigmentiphaga litoralis TaxID=516702 RepID=UPI00167BE073|nr:DUF4286 family protein [Pigmentiphaga litoralis]GGX28436.1 hypothetical protein GCM10007242_38550 [Pigmentiphaga litoralis]
MSDISVLLLKAADTHVDETWVRSLVQRLAPAYPQVLHVAAYNGLETREAYIYLTVEPVLGGAMCMSRARAHLADVNPSLKLVDLNLLLSLPGSSAGRPAPYRYTVETDVVPVAEKELNEWYDNEHLPGLAAVPGNVMARRFRSSSGSPRYHACYDLESSHTAGSPAWLAVRNTPWSGVVRPMFTNTKRTLFQRVCSYEYHRVLAEVR